MTHDEAARALGWSRGTVGTYVSRGLEQLRAILERRGLAALAGGAALEAALAVKAPALSPDRAATLAAGAIKLVEMTPLPLLLMCKVKLLAGLTVAVGLAVGLAVGGVAYLERPAAPSVARKSETMMPEPVESVPERNLRVFHAEVAPRVGEYIRSLLTGDGEVRLEKVEAFDTRIECSFILEHRLPAKLSWVPQIRILHEVHQGHTEINTELYGWGKSPALWPLLRRGELMTDPLGTDRWTATGEEVNCTRPDLIPGARFLWRNPVTKRGWHLEDCDFEGIKAAFRLLRPDERTAAVKAACDERLRAAIQPYLGKWYGRRKRTRWCEIRYDANQVIVRQVRDPLSESRTSYWKRPMWWYRFQPDGTLRAPLCDQEGYFPPDGQRIDLPETGDWLSREPPSEVKE
jgi:hypothetical protein